MDDILNKDFVEDSDGQKSASGSDDIKSPDADEKIRVDNKSLMDKIEYFSKKIEEQEEFHQRLRRESEIEEKNEISEENNQDTEEKKFVEYHKLNTELELLHQDIKICELYKKSLETEIKEFKYSITKINELENRISSLKLEAIELEKQRDLVKTCNLTLTEENEKLTKFNEQLKSDITMVLDSFKEKESIFITFKSDIDLMKNEVNDLSKMKSKLLYDISNLKREVDEKATKIESLNHEQETMNEKIDFEIQKLKNDIEAKLKQAQ
jgi:hypothetical protein